MDWPHHWTNEEFEGRMAALDALLNSHLGDPAGIVDPLDAEFVMMPLWLPAAGLCAMNPRREREKLLNVQRLASALSEAWMSLHDEIRTQMELLSTSVFEAKGKHARHSSRYPLSLDIVSVLDGLVGMAAPLANSVIDTAPAAGRRDLVSVAIVERLRMVWAERKGAPAPKSMTEAGPFAEFMLAAFETLKLPANARAAVELVARIQS